LRLWRNFAPRLFFADYHLPAFDGLEALAIAVERVPTCRLCLFPAAMGEEFAIEDLHRGAADYVLKSHLGKLAPAVTRALQEAAERNLRRKLAAIVESSRMLSCLHVSREYNDVERRRDEDVWLQRGRDSRQVGEYLTVPGGEQEIAELLSVVGSGRSVAHRETSRRCKDGRLIEVSISLSPIRESSGTISGISSIARDITERKAAERALLQLNRELQDSEGRQRTLVQTIPDLVWLKDLDGVYLSCNPPFERLRGVKAAEIIGKTDYDLVDQERADYFAKMTARHCPSETNDH